MNCSTPLTPEQRAALQASLDDARLAYHRLMTGAQARVIVDQNGERVEFSTAKSSDLYAYIQSLDQQLALPADNCYGYSGGPATFVF